MVLMPKRASSSLQLQTRITTRTTTTRLNAQAGFLFFATFCERAQAERTFLVLMPKRASSSLQLGADPRLLGETFC